MRSIFTLFITLITGLVLQAQVYMSDNVHDGTNKRSYVVLSNQNNKDITKALENYLKEFGKLSKPAKNIYRIQNLKGNPISSDLNYIDVISKSTRNLEKLEFFFLNSANNSLNDYELNPNQPVQFIEEFIDEINKDLERNLLEENYKLAEIEFKDAEKNIKKIEKSISSNLKEQQKLGKKLDSTPDLIARAMAEIEDIEGQIDEKSDTEIDDKELISLNKASQKKEKQIQKLEKDSKKAETKLSKKEDELEDLKVDLKNAKVELKAYERAFLDAKKILDYFK